MAFSQENDGWSLRYKELYLAFAFITHSPSVAYGASSLPEGAYIGVHYLIEISIIFTKEVKFVLRASDVAPMPQ